MTRLLTIMGLFAILVLAAASLPAGGRQAAAVMAAPADVFKDPESLVRGIYAAVSFDPGPAADWEYVKTFFPTTPAAWDRKWTVWRRASSGSSTTCSPADSTSGSGWSDTTVPSPEP